MHLLYIFPHPDDESFGPALAIAGQLREGHAVSLLTLTRGGATRQRHRLGLSVEEMGQVRLQEMQAVERVLGLSAMTVLDFPDSGLAEIDPRELEDPVRRHIRQLRPDIVITYPVHGVSGFPDHLVTHAVIKRAVCQMQDEEPEAAPTRLAFFTLADEPDEHQGSFDLATSPPEAIDVAHSVEAADRTLAEQALECYETYLDVIRKADPLGRVGDTVYFEPFRESFDPPLPAVTTGLDEV